MPKYCLLFFIAFLLFFQTTANAEETDCRIAYSAKTQYAPQILAFKNGWFEAPDIKFIPVDLGMSTGVAAAEALISGSADIAVMGDAPAVIALASAKPSVLVCSYGGGENMHSLIVSEKSGIKQISDLEGRTIASAFGSSAHGGLLHFLDKNGLAGSVKLVNTPQKNLVEALASDSVDAILASEPAPSLALAKVKGATRLTTLAGIGNDYPLVMIALRDYAKANPKAIEGAVAGTLMGVDFINSEPEKAAEEVAQVTGLPTDIEKACLKALDWKVRMDKTIIDSLMQTAKFLHETGKLKKVPDIASMAPTKFVVE